MNTSIFQHTKQQQNCPECGAPLQIRRGKKGLFLGCSAYPKCDYLKPLQAQTETKILKNLDALCPECGAMLQLKQGSFGMFIGCSRYPDCEFIFHENDESTEETSDEKIPCPHCGKGELVARRGRQGKIFYGCNRYPHCKFTLPSKPESQTCPHCGGAWAMLKSAVKKGDETHRTFVCLNQKCKQIFEIAN